MRLYKFTEWGYEVYLKEGRRWRQIGAGVGLTIEYAIGRLLTAEEARSWRKHGIVTVKM